MCEPDLRFGISVYGVGVDLRLGMIAHSAACDTSIRDSLLARKSQPHSQRKEVETHAVSNPVGTVVAYKNMSTLESWRASDG